MLSDPLWTHQSPGAARVPLAGGPSHVVRVPAALALGALHHPGINLWVWQRAPVRRLQAYTRRLSLAARVHVDRQFTPARDGLQPPVRGALLEAGLPAAAGLEVLAGELAQLVSLFAHGAGVGAVRLRLERIAETRERPFHYDSTTLRLLCTYRGPATQWLADDDVRRERVRGSGAGEGVERAVPRTGARVRALAPWWVAVIKGDGYPGNAGAGLVHRAPPGAQTRLRLRLDAPPAA